MKYQLSQLKALIFNNVILINIFPLLLYQIFNLIGNENQWNLYVEWVIYFVFLLFSSFYYFLYLSEKLSDFIDKKIGKVKIIAFLFYIIISVSITFSTNYFCIYFHNQNSFNLVQGNNVFEIYLDFLYYSIGLFLMNNNSSISATSLVAKLFTATEIITSFVMIIILFANFKDLQNPFNEHLENKNKNLKSNH